MTTSMLWMCLLCISAVTCQLSVAVDDSQTASTSRALSEHPELGRTVERALSRALGVPQPRLAGLGVALQGLIGSLPLTLDNLQTTLTAAAPAIAFAALVISIIALVKVTILYKYSDLSPFDTVTETIGYGRDGHKFAAEADYGGYGRYDPTEYAHHDEHVQHDDGHGAESSYASYASNRRAQTVSPAGAGGQQRSGLGSSTESRVNKPAQAAKPGRVLWN